MVKCSINGKAVEVEKGTTIIEAFKKLEKDIAHYCWHPGLSIAGVCRLCMVKIEGVPKLQIACNTEVREGMIVSNEDEEVKKTVQWGLDFHLINHPLDCPICDQSGECGLQNQYMKFGQYDPDMAEKKVKKRKVVDLGSKIVLDTERCILCSRCVRFTDEVSKTNELGIFNRGDRSEVGTFQDKSLENDYAQNTVDICPVGALTSKDFRFRQRVWYLKSAETICPGCSTGCSVKNYYNEEGFFRVQPVYNKEVNGYWMCDKGRDTYKFVNRDNRLITGKLNNKTQSAGFLVKQLSHKFNSDCSSVGVVVTGQYTCEEYEELFRFIKSKNISFVYHWQNNLETKEDFDGLLIRGDKNPNTAGLLKAATEAGVSFNPWSELSSKLSAALGDDSAVSSTSSENAALGDSKISTLVVFGPENQNVFSDIKEKLCEFSQAKNLIWLTAGKIDGIDDIENDVYQIPLKTYVEKSGTFINFNGLVQSFEAITQIVSGALTVSDVVQLLMGEDLEFKIEERKFLKTNFFSEERGQL